VLEKCTNLLGELLSYPKKRFIEKLSKLKVGDKKSMTVSLLILNQKL
jgi:hypothetical protein